METKRHIERNVVVFSKWSRKSYAIFSSLKKVVRIAQLSIDVCKSALLKSSAALQINNLIGFDMDEVADCEILEVPDDLILFSNLIPVNCINDDNYHQVENYIYTMEMPIFCSSQCMGILFYKSSL